MSRVASLPPLALVDWGIGGLGVRRALAEIAPGVGVTYVSDTGATPYGMLAPADLEARLSSLIDALAARGVERVFLACNAASTALARGAHFALPTQGMIDAGVDAVEASRARRVGVVGGRRTIASGVYRRALASRGIDVQQRVAQPLSAAIEAGNAQSDETAALVRSIVAPLRGVQVLLLACTHYPAASVAFERALPGVVLVDPARSAARIIARSMGATSRCDDVVLTTGDPASMRSSARAAFGHELRHVARFSLR